MKNANDVVIVSDKLEEVKREAMRFIEANHPDRAKQSRALFNRLQKTMDEVVIEFYKESLRQEKKTK
jgi:hypothetical protein